MGRPDDDPGRRRCGRPDNQARPSAGRGLDYRVSRLGRRFTAAITSHLTARELSGLVREEADLHKARVGAWRDSKATLAYLDRAHIAHRDFATLKDALQALADGKLDAVVDDKPILAWQIHEAFPTELQMLDLRLDPGALCDRAAAQQRASSARQRRTHRGATHRLVARSARPLCWQ